MTAPFTPRTLWRDEAGRRFYLVPDEAEPAPGPLLLRAGASRRIVVSEAAVAPYEVSKDEARAFLDAKLDGFVGGVKRSVEGALAKLGIPVAGSASGEGSRAWGDDASAAGSVASGDDPTSSGSTPSGNGPNASADLSSSAMATETPATEPGPGVKLFAALTGESPERVTDPEVFLQTLRKIGDGAAEMVKQAAHGGDEAEAARARLRAIARTMREHGIALPGGEGERPAAGDASMTGAS